MNIRDCQYEVNMSPKLSIIVPVFNCEKYILECLKSIQNQTFKDFECLIINDGSIDNSENIINEFCSSDKRFHLFTQENKGASAARNLGIKNSNGTWLTFVDADDIINENTYSISIDKAECNNVDLIQFGMQRFVDSIEVFDEISEEKFFTKDEIVDYFEPSMCNKIVLKSTITNNNVLFPTGKSLSEDRYVAFLCYLYSNKMLSITNKLYYYRTYAESSTHKMTEKNIQDEIDIINILEKKISNQNEGIKDLLEKQKIEAKNHCLFLLKKPNCEMFRNVFPECNKTCLKTKGKVGLLYLFIFLHLDIFVYCAIKIKRKQ